VPDPYDLALSKVSRNLEIDFEDVLALARSREFDLQLLNDRYQSELRPYLHGLVERHDSTLRFWSEAIAERRQRS
jgi:phytoene/squalene synthetase